MLSVHVRVLHHHPGGDYFPITSGSLDIIPYNISTLLFFLFRRNLPTVVFYLFVIERHINLYIHLVSFNGGDETS